MIGAQTKSWGFTVSSLLEMKEPAKRTDKLCSVRQKVLLVRRQKLRIGFSRGGINSANAAEKH